MELVTDTASTPALNFNGPGGAWGGGGATPLLGRIRSSLGLDRLDGHEGAVPTSSTSTPGRRRNSGRSCLGRAEM
jgi:hypothetical protein